MSSLCIFCDHALRVSSTVSGVRKQSSNEAIAGPPAQENRWSHPIRTGHRGRRGHNPPGAALNHNWRKSVLDSRGSSEEEPPHAKMFPRSGLANSPMAGTLRQDRCCVKCELSELWLKSKHLSITARLIQVSAICSPTSGDDPVA